MTTLSQNEMILAELKRRGRRGMTSRDMQRSPINCDRGAARVHELREERHPIETIMETNDSGKRYARYVYTGKRAA